jgi:dipeptidyl aminopeptidase/acylaminoacyl peptidase
MLKRISTWCLAGLLLVVLAGCAGGPPQQKEARLIPMEDFFRNPEKAGYQLSPDGTHISYLKPWNDRLNVFVQKIGSDEAMRITEATERDIRGYLWLNNNRVGWIQDTGGDENWHAYAVDIDGSNYLDATPFDGVQVRMVDDLEDDDQHILISMNKRNPQIFDVYRMDVNSGELTLVAENPGNISGWITDNAGVLRMASTTDGVNTSLLYRKNGTDEFKTVLTTSFKDTLAPLFFDFDDKYVYVSSNLERDKQAIFKWDPETGETLEMIYEHPEVDVGNLLRSKKRKVITGVAFNTDKRHYHFFDETRGALQATLEEKLPGYEVVVADMSKDETKVLVRTYSDRSLGAYYFFDRESGDFSKLADVSPWLDENELAPMKPVKYTSRDGLTIHGYLTLPLGVEAKNLPVVVNPHGGPWARDGWGFNPEVQFLANRGYAVFQMNFRGSTGYGKEFWQASFKQWGRTMQDDITDGVRWLIDQGIADPERVGIYGGSYGGYATLAGLTFTPELYACGVDYVGVSNIFTWLAGVPPYWKPFLDMIHEMVGNPETEKELLEAASPFFHVDKIQVPLLVAQGANDPRVPKAESDQIVEALRSRGIEVTYMVKDNEGHGFSNEENRFDFYRAMEEFLGQHLGGRVEGPAEES